LEGDSLVVIQKLTNRTPDRSSIRPTITDGKELAVGFTQCIFRHNKRDSTDGGLTRPTEVDRGVSG
ncbi:hypothetical protein Godav_011855, partial [Gossypium davidsonii]|nr:hypothetical protein [Gossypium davidsonii]